ncbi:MAG TPA: solute carrier family 23 protein [Bacilli bacterium]|mgnify:FL=1|nr:solute carrier family 23 protein [Bacilli bacterium]HPZ27196.1 solute carrier family 23 protein [Bacilli bacterium]HQC89482.1 solute carrier family 23 protein [Bacilli bacterium]
MEQTKALIYDAHEKPSAGKWFVLSLQHVFAMFGATILVPLTTGLPVSVALFTSGVGTLIYILCTKAKVPVYLGSSFAYITPIAIISGFNDNVAKPYYGSALTGLFVVGIIYVVIALLVKIAGKGWINKVLPPVIIGPMIAIIGFSLSSVAITSAGLVAGGSWKSILIALVAFLSVILIATFAKGFLKIIPFLVGIVGGYIFALILGKVELDPIKAVLSNPSEWVKIPEFMFLWFKDKEVTFLGTDITFYKLNFAALITIAPLAFVTACEHIGDHAVLSKICDKDFLKDPGLDRTLIGDGIATSFAAMVGGPANTTYGENTAVVGMTKIGSVWVTGLAAVIAIILSFFNVLTVIIQSIPAAVMGGMSIVLYGFIGLNGVKVLIDNRVDFSQTRNMLIASTILVLGLGGAVIDFGKFSIYGMALAAIVGILLNAILPKEKEEKRKEASKAK